jgi:hypothetical protein
MSDSITLATSLAAQLFQLQSLGLCILFYLMTGMKKLFEEKNIHLTFEISLVLKGLLAILEIIGGVLAYFVSQQFLLSLVMAVTQEELAEDPLTSSHSISSTRYRTFRLALNTSPPFIS